MVVPENISKEKGEVLLYDDIRVFFFVTCDWVTDSSFIVFCMPNDRCNQENSWRRSAGGWLWRCHDLSGRSGTESLIGLIW